MNRWLTIVLLLVAGLARGAFTERYVSVAGAGGHDGTSEGNAWTLAEGITNATSGQRVNVIKGTYSIAGGTTAAGTSSAPIWWRGYNSSIGDLDGVGRTGGDHGELITTNFPAITTSAVWEFSTFNIASNLHVIGSGINNVVKITGQAQAFESKIHSTSATGAMFLVEGTEGGTIYDSDISWASTNNSATGLYIQRSTARSCRVWCTSGATGRGVNGVDRSRASGLIIYSVGSALLLASNGGEFIGCTVYDTTGDAILATSAGSLIANNIFTEIGGYILNGTSNQAVITNNAHYNITSGPWNMGDWPVRNDTALSGDPFEDAASDDFRIDTASAGGAECEAAGLWEFVDLGPLQHEDTGGGAGGGPAQMINGGMVR